MMLKSIKLRNLERECIKYIKNAIDEQGEIKINSEKYGNVTFQKNGNKYFANSHAIERYIAQELCDFSDEIHLKPLENFSI